MSALEYAYYYDMLIYPINGERERERERERESLLFMAGLIKNFQEDFKSDF